MLTVIIIFVPTILLIGIGQAIQDHKANKKSVKETGYTVKQILDMGE